MGLYATEALQIACRLRPHYLQRIASPCARCRPAGFQDSGGAWRPRLELELSGGVSVDDLVIKSGKVLSGTT
jgi:hypothetical protein